MSVSTGSADLRQQLAISGTVEEKPFSVELCGGTHVDRTGDIGLFKVINETGTAAGVRRLEALTGLAALQYVTGLESTLLQASSLTKSVPAELPARLEALLLERKSLERQVIDLRRQLALLDAKDQGNGNSGKDQAEDAQEVGGIKLITRHLNDVPTRDLKPLVDDLKAKIGSGVVVVTSIMEGKTSLIVGVTQDLTGNLSAVDLVRAGAAVLGGNGGGGRPDLAQAGGSEANVFAVVKAIEGLMLQQVAAR